jgi:hypothetical protein
MFGMLMWESFARRLPYPDITDNELIKQQVKTGQLRPHQLTEEQHKCSPAMWKLMCECWRQEAADRPTMEAVCNRLKAFVDYHSL